MNCQFSFGPNRSYFCSAGSAYAWSDNIPTALVRFLGDATHPQAVDMLHDLALPMEAGLYALCWKTKTGQDWCEDGCLGPNYMRLARFIKAAAARGAHTTRTVFGPGAAFFSTSPAGYSWQNIPPSLEEDIHHCMKIRRPTCVALGVAGAYVVLYNDGTITFDLRGMYPLVDGMIRNAEQAARRRGVTYMALNPFVAGEYYAVYGDGSAAWNFPTAWGADVSTVSRQIRPVPLVVEEPQPVSSGVSTGGVAAGQAFAQPEVVTVASGGTGPSLTSTATFTTTSASASVSGLSVASLPSSSPTATVAVAVAGGSTGGSNIISSIGHAVGHAADAVVAEFTPTPAPPPPPPPPMYTAAPAAPAAAPEHKMTWQEGLTLGIKAVQGLNTIVKTVESIEGDVSNLNQNQGAQNGFFVQS